MRRLWIIALVVAGCGPEESTPPMESSPLTTVHDPLSMPAEPTLRPEDFSSAEVCSACHPTQFAQWQTSSHAYAMVDPLFQRLVRQRQIDLEATEDQFCTQCHSAVATRGGECVSGFEFDGLSALALEGVTCDACHRVQELVRPYNSGHRLDAHGPIGGTLEAPVENGFHASRSDPLFSKSEFCAGCHDVFETNGLALERPYEEWLESPAQVDGQTCQSCHMPESTGAAAVGGPSRTLRDHHFLGVAVPLLKGFLTDEQRAIVEANVTALLASAAELTLDVPDEIAPGHPLDVLVTVTNQISGHSLPTGTTFLRQLWLELTVTDGVGRILYQTGHLDDQGDLRDVWSEEDPFGDPDLIALTSELVDSVGNPTPFPWRASNHFSRAIPAAHARTFTLFIPVPDDVATPVHVEARLLFRSVAPWLLRAVGLAEYTGDLIIRELATATVEREVPEP